MKNLYSGQSFEFLQDLYFNNNKEWFVENKKRYEEFLLGPTKELISHLDLLVSSIDCGLETRPVINKAITTIYRDTRFSKNKTPLKTYFGINFKKPISTWKYHPSFIFRITPTGYIYGMAIMKNNPDSFHNFREDLNEPKKFKKIIAKINKNKELDLWGEEYKKYKHEDKNINKWFCKKNIYIRCHKDQGEIDSAKTLINDVIKTYQELTPLYEYFNNVFDKKN